MDGEPEVVPLEPVVQGETWTQTVDNTSTGAVDPNPESVTHEIGIDVDTYATVGTGAVPAPEPETITVDLGDQNVVEEVHLGASPKPDAKPSKRPSRRSTK